VTDEGAIRSGDVPPGWDEAVKLELDPATIPDPFDLEVPDELRAEIEAIAQVAVVMQVTPAYLSSVATFYDMLRTQPIGSRYVYVCTSVACHVRNAQKVHDAIADEAERQGLEDVDLRHFECLGACDMAPMASVDGRYVGPLDVDDAAEVVSALKEGRTVLPGRGLTDPGYRLPWDTRGQAAQSAGPEASADDDRPPAPDQAGGEPPETPEGGAA
jgi:NADH-quinone oxidoreductase subunit E